IIQFQPARLARAGQFPRQENQQLVAFLGCQVHGVFVNRGSVFSVGILAAVSGSARRLDKIELVTCRVMMPTSFADPLRLKAITSLQFETLASTKLAANEEVA